MFEIKIEHNTVILSGNDTFKIHTIRCKHIVKRMLGIGIETNTQRFQHEPIYEDVCKEIRWVMYSDINTPRNGYDLKGL